MVNLKFLAMVCGYDGCEPSRSLCPPPQKKNCELWQSSNYKLIKWYPAQFENLGKCQLVQLRHCEENYKPSKI